MPRSSRRAFLGQIGSAAVAIPALNRSGLERSQITTDFQSAGASPGGSAAAIYDLLIAGGRVVDPSQKVSAVSDVAIAGGKIARVAANIPPGQARQVFDAKGKIVTPGLIDLHTHVYQYGISLGVDSDVVGFQSGVTTVLDCGSAGAGTFAGFRKYVIDRATTRIYALLNISTIGLVVLNEIYLDPRMLDARAAIRTIGMNRDRILGIKVRVNGKHSDLAHDIEVLKTAREVSDVTGAGDTVIALLALGLAAGATLRLTPGMSLYGAARRNFKPAAPNLTEAENAEILDPETTNTQEAGLKTLWLDGKLSVNVTWFHMIFSNLVVGVLTPDGPALTNAGKVRFQGTEVEIGYALPFVDYLSLYGGYAYHDSRFKEFTFFTPDGQFRNVAGKQLELDPRNFWNFKFVLAPPQGFGGFAALRHQNHRPLNRRNTFYTPSFYQFDAGLSYVFNCFQLSVIGRNLTNSRPYTTESEIGDSQFFVNPPRGVSAQLTVNF